MKVSTRIILFFIVSVMMVSCLGNNQYRRDELKKVKSWAYWINNPDIQQLKKSNADLIVMDYSKYGDEENEFKREDILEIKKAKNGRLVIAYLSIGEAESYRFYWNKKWVQEQKLTQLAPPFLTKPNPSWPDNYKVKYWDPRWQKILHGVKEGPQKSYLDRIIDQGFDGVYLDIIDAFEYFKSDTKDSKRRMIALVKSLAEYARVKRKKPDFMIIPQNGAPIIEHVDKGLVQSYFDAIDGLGAEDTFFFGTKEMNNEYSQSNVNYIVPYIKKYQEQGLPVFSVDYVTEKQKRDQYLNLCKAHGYICLTAQRKLNSL